MIYLILALTVCLVTSQNILKHKFNKKCGKGVYTYCAMTAFSALLLFTAINRDFTFSPGILPFSAGFALSYASASVFTVLAIRHGSLARTALVVSYSLMIPTMYGIVFLNEQVNALLIAGIICLIFSLFLTNYQKSTERVTLKWVIFVILAALGNGMCSTIQKLYQEYSGGSGKNIFMIMALAMVTVIQLTAAFISERKVITEVIRKSWYIALISGIMNGAVNIMIMFMNPRLAASLIFPVISGGDMTLTFLYSVTVARERFGKLQLAGFVVGLASLILLNL